MVRCLNDVQVEYGDAKGKPETTPPDATLLSPVPKLDTSAATGNTDQSQYRKMFDKSTASEVSWDDWTPGGDEAEGAAAAAAQPAWIDSPVRADLSTAVELENSKRGASATAPVFWLRPRPERFVCVGGDVQSWTMCGSLSCLFCLNAHHTLM